MSATGRSASRSARGPDSVPDRGAAPSPAGRLPQASFCHPALDAGSSVFFSPGHEPTGLRSIRVRNPCGSGPCPRISAWVAPSPAGRLPQASFCHPALDAGSSVLFSPGHEPTGLRSMRVRNPCGSGPCPRTSVSRACSPAGRLPQALRLRPWEGSSPASGLPQVFSVSSRTRCGTTGEAGSFSLLLFLRVFAPLRENAFRRSGSRAGHRVRGHWKSSRTPGPVVRACRVPAGVRGG